MMMKMIKKTQESFTGPLNLAMKNWSKTLLKSVTFHPTFTALRDVLIWMVPLLAVKRKSFSVFFLTVMSLRTTRIRIV